MQFFRYTFTLLLLVIIILQGAIPKWQLWQILLCLSIYLPIYLSIRFQGGWQEHSPFTMAHGSQRNNWGGGLENSIFCEYNIYSTVISGCSNIGYLSPSNVNINKNHIYIIQPLDSPFVYLFPAKRRWCQLSVKLQVHAFLCHVFWKHNKSFPFEVHIKDTCLPQLCMPLKHMFNLLSFIWQSLLWETRAKNWQLHGHQWRVKTDQGHLKSRVECPVCDYATEFHNVAM